MSSRESRHLAFGKESVSGPPMTPDRYYPVIPMGSERCEVCGAIRPFEDLIYTGHADDEDATPLYECAGDHATALR